jgi:5-methyltetrahydrofolate--homocysteine methyltransferase
LALQREAQRVADARGAQRVMLAAPAGELHVVALRMVDNLLRDAGYDVVMLGADVPADALAWSARRHEPAVICLSSTMPGGADQVLISIHEIQQEWSAAGFVIGGPALTSRVQSGPGIDTSAAASRTSWRPSTRWSSARA